jgi:NAD(P)-dependent dehydrogenase (short-subunit alcohol dehydrogenase family)
MESKPKVPTDFPSQHQNRHPGIEASMDPHPIYDNPHYKAAGKLEGKAAVITGGDSGIGRAVAITYAREGADVAIIYLNEDKDADFIRTDIEALGKKCVLIKGDIGDEKFCKKALEKANKELGKIDILINNAAEQHVTESLDKISSEQLEKTYKTNVFGQIYLTREALSYLQKGGIIINTVSVQAYDPSPELVDYASTKGAMLNFTRTCAQELIQKGIRVNAVAPGPVWTPLIPSSFPAKKMKEFGKKTPMGRAAQPYEMAPAYVYLACEDSSYMVGQVLHLNGGSLMSS